MREQGYSGFLRFKVYELLQALLEYVLGRHDSLCADELPELRISAMAITRFAIAITQFGHGDHQNRSEATLDGYEFSSGLPFPFGEMVRTA